MKGEVFKKLNQNDRIEYLLLEQKNERNSDSIETRHFLVLLIVLTVIGVGQAITLKYIINQDKIILQEGISIMPSLLILALIMYGAFLIMDAILDKIYSNRLDKKFLEKLDIKARGNKPK